MWLEIMSLNYYRKRRGDAGGWKYATQRRIEHLARRVRSYGVQIAMLVFVATLLAILITVLFFPVDDKGAVLHPSQTWGPY